MEGYEIELLINEAHEAVLLKRLLADKLARGYGGIKHDELELIGAMFGIWKKEVEKE